MSDLAERDAKILALYREDVPRREIAERCNTTINVVENVIKLARKLESAAGSTIALPDALAPDADVPFHVLANLFPLIEGEDFEALVTDIKANGLRERIVLDKPRLLGGEILDGRNRFRACRAAGVSPLFDQVKPGTDLLAFVISKNLQRRHLTDDQRRMVAAKIATLGRGRPGENFANGEINREQAAKLLHVDVAGVDRAKAVVARGAKELQHAVEHGDVTVRAAADIAKLPKAEQKALLIKVAESPGGKRALKQAAKEVRGRDQAVAHRVRQELAERKNAANPSLPVGRTFNLVLIDVPRKHNAYGETGNEKAPDNHYPCMSFEELLAFPIDCFAAKDAIIVYWSTAASLIDDIEILAEWGFIALRPRDGLGRLVRPNDEPLPPLPHRGAYGSHQIWRKLRSGKAMGMGRWFRDQHELLIVARRGNIPAPLPGTQAESVIEAEVSDHSSKPNEDTFTWIDRCWPHLSKVYIFARGGAPAGWTFWGNEVEEIATSGPDPASSGVPEDTNPAAEPRGDEGSATSVAGGGDDALEIPAFLRRSAA